MNDVPEPPSSSGAAAPAEPVAGLVRGDGALVHAFAPGRVNLIGEHTDYAGGLALPMAVQLGTTVRAVRTGTHIELTSDHDPRALHLPLPVGDPTTVEPDWGRYVAGVVAVLASRGRSDPSAAEADPAARRGAQEVPAAGGPSPLGLRGSISTTLPVGAGLSSSAALEVAVALALGATGTARAIAELARDAEQLATGVPCGLMDQLAATCGAEGHALLMDFADGSVTPVRMPEGLEVVVVHSGQERRLATSPYAERRREIEAAIVELGDPRTATATDVAAIADPVLRRRARHLVSENRRVLAVVNALAAGSPAEVGRILDDGHASLRHDLEVSTPVVDQLCDELRSRPGVLGVRLTGAGFGGCVVALTEPAALDVGWRVAPGPGAWVKSG